MSTRLIRLEAADGNPYVGGIAVEFDSGVAKRIQWQCKPGELISPALDAAKEYTAALLQELMREGREQELRDTNWVSVTAAVHKCIRDFNGKLHQLQSEQNAAPVQ